MLFRSQRLSWIDLSLSKEELVTVTKLRLVCLFAALSIGQMWGQGTASVSGNILDQSGSAIANANVTARNTATGFSRSVTSDAQGHYEIVSIPIGPYEVKASQTGFQSVVRNNVELLVGSQPVVDLQLPVGQAEQTVSVTGEISQVDINTAALSTQVNTTQMRELPLNGRNVEQLILLAPGAVAYPNGQQSALVGRGLPFAISGSRPEGYANLIDRKSTRLNSSHIPLSRMPSSA